mgnify:CR=1 FL=1
MAGIEEKIKEVAFLIGAMRCSYSGCGYAVALIYCKSHCTLYHTSFRDLKGYRLMKYSAKVIEKCLQKMMFSKD